MTKTEKKVEKWDIFFCDNMFCSGYLRHWPVEKKEDKSEQKCPECQFIGRKLTAKQRGELLNAANN